MMRTNWQITLVCANKQCGKNFAGFDQMEIRQRAKNAGWTKYNNKFFCDVHTVGNRFGGRPVPVTVSGPTPTKDDE